MRPNRVDRTGIAWPESLFLLALLALLLQVFPSLWFALVAAADARNWPRAVWMSLNVGIVITLFAMRFGPELGQVWRQRGPRSNRKRDDSQLTMKEERALYERMREARKRQVV